MPDSFTSLLDGEELPVPAPFQRAWQCWGSNMRTFSKDPVPYQVEVVAAHTLFTFLSAEGAQLSAKQQGQVNTALATLGSLTLQFTPESAPAPAPDPSTPLLSSSCPPHGYAHSGSDDGGSIIIAIGPPTLVPAHAAESAWAAASYTAQGLHPCLARSSSSSTHTGPATTAPALAPTSSVPVRASSAPRHCAALDGDGSSVAHEGAVHVGSAGAKRFLLNEERSDCSIGAGQFKRDEYRTH